MFLSYLFKGLGLVRNLLSYGLILPYSIVIVPWRAAYHFACIVSAPKLINSIPDENGSSNPVEYTPSASPKQYEDFEDYEYMPLPSERHIRLLRVHAFKKEKDEDIKCELISASLDHYLTLYQAVSYTWDDQTPDRHILCEGKRLPVTKNCEAILYDLRPSTLGCVLWIDAICINQNSTEEKAAQVPLMSHIYKRSQKVVIWLPDPAPARGLIFNYLWLLWCCSIWPSPIRSWLIQRLYRYMKNNHHTALARDLTRRNWWQRVWTIQEAALAPEAQPFAWSTTVLRCGIYEIPFDLLVHGLETLGAYEGLTDTYTFNHLIWSSYIVAHHLPRLYSFSRRYENFHIMMHRNQGCNTSNPKDRVYGVYGMLLEQGLHLPQPSYLKTVEEIYWEFTATVFRETGDLGLMELVTGPDENLAGPSWVPNFNGPWRVGHLLGLPTATRDSKSEFCFADCDKTLVVSGMLVDFVHKKSNLTTWQPDNVGPKTQDGPLLNLMEGFERTIHAFRDWTRVLFTHGVLNIYDTHENFMESFGKVLLGGFGLDFATLRSSEETRIALFTWIGWIQLILSEENRAMDFAVAKEDPLIKETFFQNPDLQHLTEIEEWQALCTLKTHPMTAKLHHAIWMATRDKIFFTTMRGYIGTGHFTIQENDVIVLIAGVSRPMLLRPTSDEQIIDLLTWRVVGPVYIEGMMESELWGEEAEMQQFRIV